MRTACVTSDMLLMHTNRNPEGLVRVISPGNILCEPTWHALSLDLPSLQWIQSVHLTRMLSFPLNASLPLLSFLWLHLLMREKVFRISYLSPVKRQSIYVLHTNVIQWRKVWNSKTEMQNIWNESSTFQSRQSLFACRGGLKSREEPLLDAGQEFKTVTNRVLTRESSAYIWGPLGSGNNSGISSTTINTDRVAANQHL